MALVRQSPTLPRARPFSLITPLLIVFLLIIVLFLLIIVPLSDPLRVTFTF